MTATVNRGTAAASTDSDPENKAAGAKAKKPSLLKSKKGIAAVIALLAIGGGAYKFAMPTKVEPPTGGDTVTLTTNTVNLAGGDYLQIALAIELVKGKASATDFQTSHAAELLINEFSGLQAASLQRAATREKLHNQLKAALKEAYPGEVYDMFFTTFYTGHSLAQ